MHVIAGFAGRIASNHCMPGGVGGGILLKKKNIKRKNSDFVRNGYPQPP